MPGFVRSPALPTLTLALLISACGSPSEPAGPEPGTITAEGGVVTANGGQVKLTVPPGALSSPTKITVTEAENPPSDPNLLDGTAFDFGPDGLVFDEPVTLEIGYSEGDLREDGREARLRIHRWEGTEWRPVAEGGVDAGTNRVTGTLTGFSSYALLEVPCAPAPLSVGGSVAGRLTAEDCQTRVDGEPRYEELFSVELDQTVGFGVRLFTAGALPSVGLSSLHGSRASAPMLATNEPSGGEVAEFTVLAGAGSHRIIAASRHAREAGFELSLNPVSVRNALGCTRGMFVVPPVEAVGQEIDDASDCIVTIQHNPDDPDVVGKKTVEEYFWIKVPAGKTVTITTTRTGGESDFRPFPTLFLGGGEVVQTDGSQGAASKTISHTAAEGRFFLLGVSSILDGNDNYTQGSYALSVEVK